MTIYAGATALRQRTRLTGVTLDIEHDGVTRPYTYEVCTPEGLAALVSGVNPDARIVAVHTYHVPVTDAYGDPVYDVPGGYVAAKAYAV